MVTLERQSNLNSEICAVDSRARFMQTMSHVGREFSFEHATVMIAPSSQDALLAPLVLESTIPAEFVREFDRYRYLRHCPVIPKMNYSVVPHCWTILKNGGVATVVYPVKMATLMQRYALVTSVIFPMNSTDGSRFFLRFDGSRCLLSQPELNELGMIALHLFDVFDTLRRNQPASPSLLSIRELEVLRWTAQGKTSIEIGQILSLSDHTINAYMTNAIRKLDCVNRTQLVAKAIRLKLIA